MAISSTTLSSLRSSGSVVFGLTSRPPIISATTLPPPASCHGFVSAADENDRERAERRRREKVADSTRRTAAARRCNDADATATPVKITQRRRDKSATIDRRDGESEINNQQLGFSAGLVLSLRRSPFGSLNRALLPSEKLIGDASRRHDSTHHENETFGASFCSGLSMTNSSAAAEVEHAGDEVARETLRGRCCRSSRNRCRPAARRRFYFPSRSIPR